MSDTLSHIKCLPLARAKTRTLKQAMMPELFTGRTHLV